MSTTVASTQAGEGSAPGRIRLGPHSHIARFWSTWPYIVPFASRVLALQGMHPVVAAGIEDHSAVYAAPGARAWETIRYGLEVVFGDTDGTTAQIRELHRGIKGVGYDGKRYHAWQSAAWAWVHLTTFEAMLYSLRAVSGPVPLDEQEAMYAEWKAVGRLYGVRDRDMPADIPGLHAYIRHGVEHELIAAPTVERLFEDTIRHLPPPPSVPMPRPAWSLIQALAGPVLFVLLAGAFPGRLRRRMGIRWTPVHAATYRSVLGALRVAMMVLPERLTLFPIAYRSRLHARSASATAPSSPSCRPSANAAS